MAVGPIPFTAIVQYSRLWDIDDDYHDFSYFIRRMDTAFLLATDKKKKGSQLTGDARNGANSSKANSRIR